MVYLPICENLLLLYMKMYALFVLAYKEELLLLNSPQKMLWEEMFAKLSFELFFFWKAKVCY